jgi:hypothetical protein
VDVGPAAFHQHPVVGSDDPEAGALMQREAGGVLGEDAALDGPDVSPFRAVDQVLQQPGADVVTASGLGDVDAIFDDAGVDASRRNRRRGNSACDLVAVGKGRKAMLGQVVGIEGGPIGSGGGEGGVAGVDALLVDRQHAVGVLSGHGYDPVPAVAAHVLSVT